MAKKDDKFVVSPCDYAGDQKNKVKGGAGEYDGMKGYPGRTKSSSGVPEKFMETMPENTTSIEKE